MESNESFSVVKKEGVLVGGVFEVCPEHDGAHVYQLLHRGQHAHH